MADPDPRRFDASPQITMPAPSDTLNLPNPDSNAAVVVDRGLDARTPLLLLPVNIETRFISSQRGDELWVRVYPDQIAINSHEPELTAQEVTDGTHYWDAVWRAGLPPANLDDVKAPWRELASLYTPERAAWIALQMTPQNIVQQPVAPTPPSQSPNPAPSYPSPPTRDSSWQKPAMAACLPSAWTVVLVSGITTSSHRGSVINPSLAVGFTPGAGAFPPGSPVDAGLQWLIDFDQALAAGMALKIPITAAQKSAGFDRIFVYGLRVGEGANSELQALINAHHYTDGFAFVPQGSPTNNTNDASSAFSSKDPNSEISFAVERQAALNSSANCDANVFASMLGLDPNTFAHIRFADGINEQSGADAVTALWPATLGYFLDQMMAKVFSADQIEQARQYVIANAIPRGPIPAFRTGKTPYGVAPVTSLARYKPVETRLTAPSVEAPLVDFVRRMWQSWLDSSGQAPHMQTSGDPDQQLVSVLGMDASSMAFRARTILGDDFLWNYLSFLNVSAALRQGWWSKHLAAGRQTLDTFGFNTWDPRVIHLGMAPTSFPISLPTVQSAPLSETQPLAADADFGGGNKGNYIQWLRQASIDDIRAENYPGPQPSALLYKILRQAVLLDYVTLAINSEALAGRLQASQLAEKEIVAIALSSPPPQPPVSPWELLVRPSIPNPAMTWAEYLVSVDPPPESPFARLADLRASLDRLAKLSTAELDRLLTEFLDACSHRLDVWATAIANAMLKRTRNSQVNGIHLGAFGWVEEVKASSQPAPVQGTELESVQIMDRIRAERMQRQTVLPVPQQPQVDNGGFIYAPSLDQARTAAVLRNGYMTHKGTADEGLLSLDISSDRVRKALYLLEGVRQGQSLNALLGYLFESEMHVEKLDKYIQPFRDRFPVVANKLTPSSDPTEALAASNVVDGVGLRNAFDQGAFPVGGNWGPGLPAGADQNSTLAVIQIIDDYADALGDVSIAEAVFQIMRGNFGRAGGLMDAISKGDRPPDPDFVATPRGGIDLTHRVSLLFAGDPLSAAAWSGIPKQVRAAAEPWLDAWLSNALPDPAQVACTATFQSGGAAQSRTIHLTDLNVGPLDCLAMADSAEVPQQAELEARILSAAALPADASDTKIDYTAPAGFIAFPDFFFLAASWRAVIGSSRALTPQDMSVPEKNAGDLGGKVDTTELASRAAAAVASLSNGVSQLQTAIASGVPGNMRTALLGASYFGVSGAVAAAGNDAAIPDQAIAALKTLTQRQKQTTAVNLATASEDDILSVFSATFGAGFVVLPRFQPPDAPSIQGALAQSASLVSSDPAAPSRWLNQLTHVRSAMSRLDQAQSLYQILTGSPIAPAPTLGQLPLQASDRWLALPTDPNKPPLKGRVVFTCFAQGDPVSKTPYAGLLIDEWPERIPSKEERAAVAFHYEEPKARAPQSLLLAVCPDSRPTWDDDLIFGVLDETLQLAKIRTVDLDSVQKVGQILPALYFAFNLQGATLSTSFISAKEVFSAPTVIR